MTPTLGEETPKTLKGNDLLEVTGQEIVEWGSNHISLTCQPRVCLAPCCLPLCTLFLPEPENPSIIPMKRGQGVCQVCWASTGWGNTKCWSFVTGETGLLLGGISGLKKQGPIVCFPPGLPHQSDHSHIPRQMILCPFYIIFSGHEVRYVVKRSWK